MTDEERRGGEWTVSKSAGSGDAEPVFDGSVGDGGEKDAGEEEVGEAAGWRIGGVVGVDVDADLDASGDVGGEFGRGSSSGACCSGSGGAVRGAADPGAGLGGGDDAVLTASPAVLPLAVLPASERCDTSTCNGEVSVELLLLRMRSSNEGRALRLGRIPSCIQTRRLTRAWSAC